MPFNLGTWETEADLEFKTSLVYRETPFWRGKERRKEEERRRKKGEGERK